MADIFDPRKRSEIMAAIRSHGNARTELALLAVFREHRVTGWRRRRPLPGRPDFTFPQRRLAVFVDGCFWHGCPDHGRLPKSNGEFWREKIARNRERDAFVNRLLAEKSWTVLRVWEHELARRRRPALLARLRAAGLLPPEAPPPPG